jgi:hypothetical protein
LVSPPQEPERRAAERDEARIQQWIEHDWPRIKRKARRRNAHPVCLDEVGFMLGPTGQHTWAPVGETPILEEHRRHRRPLSGIGALSIPPHRKPLGRAMPLHEGSIGEAWGVAFLRGLQRHRRGDIVLGRDHLGVPHSARVENYDPGHEMWYTQHANEWDNTANHNLPMCNIS